MIDNETIKDLEEFLYTLEDGYTSAIEFGGKRDEQIEKEIYLIRDTISIIKRQKEKLELSRKNNKAIMQTIADVRAEAIKGFAEKTQNEIKEAIESNYKAKEERVETLGKYGLPVNPEDDFLMYCDGKIHALSGLSYFVEQTAKEMVGDNNAE